MSSPASAFEPRAEASDLADLTPGQSSGEAVAGGHNDPVVPAAETDAAPVRRRDWVITIAVLVFAVAVTVAVLATLWLRPGSGSVGV